MQSSYSLGETLVTVIDLGASDTYQLSKTLTTLTFRHQLLCARVHFIPDMTDSRWSFLDGH